MTRVLSYNILVGGTRRVTKLANIIAVANADIVGLVEANDPLVVETLAQLLNMQYVMSGRARHYRDWQVAILSRLPIIDSKVHTYPEVLTRNHLLEVTVEEADGRHLTVFVIHLTADFYNGMSAVRKRRREIQLALSLMSKRRGQPHLLMGDLNSIAPGEPVYGTKLLRYQLHKRDEYYKSIEALTDGAPKHLTETLLRACIISPFIHLLLESRAISTLIDHVGYRYAQGGIDLLQQAGYLDCFRQANPRACGFTCPASALSGRIDYIFASPELAPRLVGSEVISEGNGVRGEEASDHLPVLAEFA